VIEAIISSVVSTLVSALVTILVSRWYYIRASRELVEETRRLRNHTRIIIETFEKLKILEPVRENSNEIIGKVDEGYGSPTLPPITGSASGT
jgi:hypothetical protein